MIKQDWTRRILVWIKEISKIAFRRDTRLYIEALKTDDISSANHQAIQRTFSTDFSPPAPNTTNYSKWNDILSS